MFRKFLDFLKSSFQKVPLKTSKMSNSLEDMDVTTAIWLDEVPEANTVTDKKKRTRRKKDELDKNDNVL